MLYFFVEISFYQYFEGLSVESSNVISLKISSINSVESCGVSTEALNSVVTSVESSMDTFANDSLD